MKKVCENDIMMKDISEALFKIIWILNMVINCRSRSDRMSSQSSKAN